MRMRYVLIRKERWLGLHSGRKFGTSVCFVLSLLLTFIAGCKGGESKNMEETIFFQSDITSLSFTNDLGITNIGDPFMLKLSANEYYMYCTSAANGFYCWRSEDMVHWTDKKMCYVMKTDAWCYECFWAPEVVAYEGKYYMFYTAKKVDDGLRIGLAVSDTPDGPFEDYKNEPLFDFGYATIDANVFIDDDGSKYLYYAKDCSDNMVDGIHTSQLYGVKLADDMKSVVGEPVFLTTPEQKWERIAGNYMWNEGPEMIKHDGTYYLSYSADCFESPGYSLGYATSENPLGPFEKPEDNRILHAVGLRDVSGTGHHSFVYSPDDSELWVAYHSRTSVIAPSGNRKVNLARAGFTEDGKLYINGPLTAAQPLPSGVSTTNITAHFKADVNGQEAAGLTDGVIQVHEKPDHAVVLPVDSDGKVIISMKADTENELEVSGLALYAGYDRMESISSIRICVNNERYSEEYRITEETTSPIILSFADVSAKNIDVIVIVKEGETDVALSEIEIFKIK